MEILRMVVAERFHVEYVLVMIHAAAVEQPINVDALQGLLVQQH